MLRNIARGPSSAALGGLLVAALFVAGVALLSTGEALTSPVTYVLAALLGVGYAVLAARRSRSDHRPARS